MNIQIDKTSNITIQQQLINIINRAIANHELEQGDILPSINQISADLGISRDTVFKSYKELKRLKIVDSTPAKGYYVNQHQKKVLLLLDYFSPFKETLHNAFKKNISAEYTIDLVFHHYNKNLFESIIQQSIGMYDVFIVMNLDTNQLKINNNLKKIDPSKLLLIDIPVKEWSDFDSEKYSTICQDFGQAVYYELMNIKNEISKYSSFNLINNRNLNHPTITVNYFIDFCQDSNINYNIYNDIESHEINKGESFFILRQHDLSFLLKTCREKGYQPGKEIGIITYNDSPLYEFIGNGISVISTDFELMGKKAADFVINRKVCKEIIPTKIKLRASI